VSYLPGRNVLDPTDHAAWQLGADVQVQDEDAVGAQFELAGVTVGGGADRGMFRFCCMHPTVRGGAVTRDGTGVRSGLETG